MMRSGRMVLEEPKLVCSNVMVLLGLGPELLLIQDHLLRHLDLPFICSFLLSVLSLPRIGHRRGLRLAVCWPNF